MAPFACDDNGSIQSFVEYFFLPCMKRSANSELFFLFLLPLSLFLKGGVSGLLVGYCLLFTIDRSLH